MCAQALTIPIGSIADLVFTIKLGATLDAGVAVDYSIIGPAKSLELAVVPSFAVLLVLGMSGSSCCTL
jgi:hypothetical protein